MNWAIRCQRRHCRHRLSSSFSFSSVRCCNSLATFSSRRGDDGHFHFLRIFQMKRLRPIVSRCIDNEYDEFIDSRRRRRRRNSESLDETRWDHDFCASSTRINKSLSQTIQRSTYSNIRDQPKRRGRSRKCGKTTTTTTTIDE